VLGGLNAYSYAQDNPVNLVDPFGLTNRPGDYGWPNFDVPPHFTTVQLERALAIAQEGLQGRIQQQQAWAAGEPIQQLPVFGLTGTTLGEPVFDWWENTRESWTMYLDQRDDQFLATLGGLFPSLRNPSPYKGMELMWEIQRQKAFIKRIQDLLEAQRKQSAGTADCP
jgi:hypothetical protein